MKYTVEFSTKRYREYIVEAKDIVEANSIAFQLLENDIEYGSIDNWELNYIQVEEKI